MRPETSQQPGMPLLALRSVFISLILPLSLVALPGCGNGGASAIDGDGIYTYGESNAEGIGKQYMGREISHVMGHRGARWLERPEREREERTDLLLENLPLEPDDVIADIGAGTGYFSLRIAERLVDGRVLAVDLQPEMLDIIRTRMAERGIDNVDVVQASADDPKLPPASVDLVLMVDAYHEFEWPREVMNGIVTGLKPRGRVLLIEYREEDPEVPILRLHKMSERQARVEMEAVGLRFIENRDMLPQQHFLLFQKPAEKPGQVSGGDPGN